MNVPLLESQLPIMIHPQMNAIVDDIKEYYKTDIFNISSENARLYGDHMSTGALYSSYIHPLGNIDKVKAVSRYYCYWALMDDQFFDNSVDLDSIIQTFDGFQSALNEAPDIEKIFLPISEFCSRTDWTMETKEMFKSEMNRYLESVLKLRTIEVQMKVVSLEEYLSYRAFDVAMNVIYSLAWYIQHDMPSSLYYSAEFEKIFEYSGISIGLLLDLYTLKAKKKEIRNYAHAIRIIQRAENCDEEEAINKGVRLFYEYDSKLEEEFNRLEAKYPDAIRYFRYIQSGSVKYCNESRKIRYKQVDDIDENLVKGRTVI
ncbi:terpene synthase family protein [Chryseobacterium populi]|uniref:Terpene synthase n=1 Tax=Chryseobacterium populi TaxID=1144316 RepID=J2T0B9_9FLAO|nr:terpene synthase family protein [Chryseobacterium populi]EJL71407.1 hypothetical protein PMI13_02355 [Chryseobacterium populi]